MPSAVPPLPGYSQNPHDPHVIASQFESALFGQNAAPATGTPNAQDAGTQEPAPDAGETNEPQAGEETQPQANPAVRGEDGMVSTTDDLAALFEGTNTSKLLSSVTHTIGEREYSLSEIIDGFAANPEALEVISQRDGLESEFEQAGMAQRAEHESALEDLALIQAELSAQLSEDESPERLAEFISRGDNVGYQAMQLKIQTRKIAAEKARSELDRQNDKKADEDRRKQEDYLAKQARKLSVAFPEWDDEEKGPVIRAKLSTYARRIGFTAPEMNSITDHRFLVLMRDAAMGSAMSSRGLKAIKNAMDKKLPAPAARASARGEVPSSTEQSNTGRADSFAKLQQDGSLKNLSSLFSQMVD